MHRELIDVIEEEADIVGEDRDVSPTERIDVAALRSAVRKLRSERTDLSRREKVAVADALTDVGELYRFAGSSAGFDVDEGDSLLQMRRRGKLARDQATSLGVN